MDERTEFYLWWALILAIIIIAGLLCQYVLTIYPPPQVVFLNTTPLDLNNTMFISPGVGRGG